MFRHLEELSSLLIRGHSRGERTALGRVLSIL